MSDKDQIKELFSQKLGGYEAKVNPELWTNIASQVGAATTTTAAASGMSLFTKAIIGITSAAVVTTGIVLYATSTEEAPKKKETPVEQSTDKPITAKASSQDQTTVFPDNNAVSNTQVSQPETKPTSTPSDNLTVFGRQMQRGSVSGSTTPGEMDGQLPPNEVGPGKVDPNDVKIATAGVPATSEKANPKGEETKPAGNLPVDGDNNTMLGEDEPTDVAAQPTQELKPLEFELPSIFTPNRDNRNDFFYFDEIPDNLTAFSFIVKDQNGETVFVSDSPDFRWDGRNMYTGELVKKGIHAYVVIAEDDLGRTFKSSQYLMIEY